jgi:hypothetical protein
MDDSQNQWVCGCVRGMVSDQLSNSMTWIRRVSQILNVKTTISVCKDVHDDVFVSQ